MLGTSSFPRILTSPSLPFVVVGARPGTGTPQREAGAGAVLLLLLAALLMLLVVLSRVTAQVGRVGTWDQQ